MESFFTGFRGKSIQFKLLFYFVSLILLAIIPLGLISNYIYSRSIENATTDHTIQMIQQVNKNIEQYIFKMDGVISCISEEPEVIEFLKVKSRYDSNRVDVETEVRRILTTFKEANPEIAGILVVNENNIYISNEIYRLNRDPLTEDLWYQKAVENPQGIQLLSKPIGRNVYTSLNYTADDIVSVVKALRDPVSGEVVGVLLIDMKLETIKEAIEDITLGKNGFIYVIGLQGEVVYAPVNPIVYRVKDDWLKMGSSGSVVKRIKGSSYQILYSDSDYTKWKTVGVFSLNETLKEVNRIRYYSVIAGVLTVILALVVAFFFTSSIAKPLSKLRHLMKLAEGGDLEVHFQSKYDDEIGQLGNSFNTMIGEIRKLIGVVYAEQKSKREAELKILQAQIKPHFLYNTLDTIQWMAQGHGAQDIIEMVGALTNLFRTGLSRGNEFLKTGEELEHVKSYMVIQKARYEDKLDFSMECDEGMLDYKVLKLILQPLVENAIYHGVKAKRGVGKIMIDAKIEAGEMVFTVTDNGAGIPPDKLQAINTMLQRKDPNGKNPGYGIFNVNERIQLSFGEQYGLSYQSVLGQGTTVTVRHPILEA